MVDEVEHIACTNCGRMTPKDQLNDEGRCEACGSATEPSEAQKEPEDQAPAKE